MKADVQIIKTYTVTLDEIEMLELCEEISNLNVPSVDKQAVQSLRACLEGA